MTWGDIFELSAVLMGLGASAYCLSYGFAWLFGLFRYTSEL
jgi:hypothetical protein